MKMIVLVIIISLVFVLPIFAQDTSTAPVADAVSPWSFLIGVVVSLFVMGLRRVPVLGQYPKLVAGAVALIVAAVQSYATSKGNVALLGIVANAGTQLTAAIATWEIALKNLKSQER